MILKMPHQQVGEVNLVDEMVDRLLDILADKLTERLSAGHKELYTAKELAGIQFPHERPPFFV